MLLSTSLSKTMVGARYNKAKASGAWASGSRLSDSRLRGWELNDRCGELGREGRMVLVSELEDRMVLRQSTLSCESVAWRGLAWIAAYGEPGGLQGPRHFVFRACPLRLD